MTTNPAPLLALSPCPFCGGAADLNGDDTCGYFVSCRTRDCCMFNRAIWAADEITSAWNHREPDPTYWRNHHAAALRVIDELRAANAREGGNTIPENHLPVHVALIKDFEQLGNQCLDGGACHHGCTKTCFRKNGCVPLSISESFLNDDWTIKTPPAPGSDGGL